MKLILAVPALSSTGRHYPHHWIEAGKERGGKRLWIYLCLPSSPSIRPLVQGKYTISPLIARQMLLPAARLEGWCSETVLFDYERNNYEKIAICYLHSLRYKIHVSAKCTNNINRNQRHILRDRWSGTTAYPACWAMGTNKLRKHFCTGPIRAAKAGQKSLVPAKPNEPSKEGPLS